MVAKNHGNRSIKTFRARVCWRTPLGVSLIWRRVSAVVVPFSAPGILPGGHWWALSPFARLLRCWVDQILTLEENQLSGREPEGEVGPHGSHSGATVAEAVPMRCTVRRRIQIAGRNTERS